MTIILLLFASAAVGQVTEEWVARYNGSANDVDIARAVAVDAQGNVYVTGSCRGSATYSDYATIMYDSEGNELWLARYNGPGSGDDYAKALAVDADGNVYVTGSSEGSDTDYDYATIKYDPNGNQLWARRYNRAGNNYDGAYAIAVDSEGNVYVTGISGPRYGGEDYATIKYDSSGNELWVACYNGPGNYDDEATALVVDAEGSAYVTGWSYGSGTYSDYATIKYGANGNQLWVARHNGPGDDWDEATALAVDAGGNVYVTGSTSSSGPGYDYATIKYDSLGNQLWVARYNHAVDTSDVACGLTVDAQGNVYVTGYSFDPDTNEDYATVKYDSSGNELWVARYNGPTNGFDGASALAVDGRGDIYVTGLSFGFDTYWDYTTIKYDLDGNELWIVRYDGPVNGYDYAEALAVDQDGKVYITGWSKGDGTDYDYATIKYSQQTAVETGPSDNTLPGGFRLTCLPNPFNASTSIAYALAQPGEVKLTIHNLKGQLMETLVDDFQEVGEHSVTWDASNHSSGIYFYKLTAGDYTETRRVTLLK
ncbi:MAG: SBBP repeat-containing protein [Candidatus Zixiibacteriota bacterium]